MLGGRQGVIGEYPSCVYGREPRLRLFHRRPLRRLCLLLHPARHPHGHGLGREARPQPRGGGALARRLLLARGRRRHHSGADAGARCRRGAICFATSMGAFGTAFTLATDINVLPMTIYTEFTLRANIAYRGGAQRRARRDHLDRARDCAHGCGQHRRGGRIARMRPQRPLLSRSCSSRCSSAPFMFVPIVLSIMAGFTANYIRGVSSGLTLRWIVEVWASTRDAILLSLLIALACLAVTLVIGVPARLLSSRRPITGRRG